MERLLADLEKYLEWACCVADVVVSEGKHIENTCIGTYWMASARMHCVGATLQRPTPPRDDISSKQQTTKNKFGVHKHMGLTAFTLLTFHLSLICVRALAAAGILLCLSVATCTPHGVGDRELGYTDSERHLMN